MSPPRNRSTLPRYNPTQPEQAQPVQGTEKLSRLLLECRRCCGGKGSYEILSPTRATGDLVLHRSPITSGDYSSLANFLRVQNNRGWRRGSSRPKYSYALGVAMRPRGVRSIMPICMRYGSYISSIASSS